MMRRSRRLTGIIIVCLIVITMTVIGCGGDDNGSKQLHTQTPGESATQASTFTPSATASPALTPSADADTVIDRAIDNLKNITVYGLNRWITLAKWTASDKSDASGNDIYSSMKLDLSGHNMEMNNTANIKTYGKTSGSVRESKIYVIGDMLYVQGYYPDSPLQWVKMSVDEDYLLLSNQARLVVELSGISEKEILTPEVLSMGNESIGCYVIKVTPELEKFWEIIVQQPWIQLPLEPPEGYSFDQIIRNAGMKLWLSQTSFLPIKAELDLSIEVGNEMIPTITGTVNMGVEVLMQFDYNEQITIELPQEAMSASDLDLQQSQ